MCEALWRLRIQKHSLDFREFIKDVWEPGSLPRELSYVWNHSKPAVWHFEAIKLWWAFKRDNHFWPGKLGSWTEKYCFTGWLSIGVTAHTCWNPMLRVKGKTSQDFRMNLFFKRNWPIGSWRVASCLFKLVSFRVCRVVLGVSL